MKLLDNDHIQTESSTFQVLHTPGHTLGHIALYESEAEILICEDLFHRNYVGWLNIFREGISSMRRSLDSIDLVSTFQAKRAYSGHGPQIEDPHRSIDTVRKRLINWLKSPEKVSCHACKRIFAFTLIIKNGLPKEEIDQYLLHCAWFQDFSRHAFQLQPEEFIQVLIDEIIRSGAASCYNDHLISTAS